MSDITAVSPKVDEETLKRWLQGQVSEERYFHSLGAQKKAIELARFFKLAPSDVDKAGIAGLLHDCAKQMKPTELFDACQTLGITLTDEERATPQTLHPFVGAELVRWEFSIEDVDILNAMRYHTTGRKGMTDVEKVVFIADKIEENTRNPLYTQKINAQINCQDKRTMDNVVRYILDSTITFLVEKGQIIHPRTIEARNELVRQLKPQSPLSRSQQR